MNKYLAFLVLIAFICLAVLSVVYSFKAYETVTKKQSSENIEILNNHLNHELEVREEALLKKETFHTWCVETSKWMIANGVPAENITIVDRGILVVDIKDKHYKIGCDNIQTVVEVVADYKTHKP